MLNIAINTIKNIFIIAFQVTINFDTEIYKHNFLLNKNYNIMNILESIIINFTEIKYSLFDVLLESLIFF